MKLNSSNVVVISNCPFDIPPVIYIPAVANGSVVIATSHRLTSADSWSTQTSAFTVSARNYAVWIDVQTMRVRKANGTYADQVISVTADIDKALVRYGQNAFYCAGVGVESEIPKLYYYNLSMGEV